MRQKLPENKNNVTNTFITFMIKLIIFYLSSYTEGYNISKCLCYEDDV